MGSCLGTNSDRDGQGLESQEVSSSQRTSSVHRKNLPLRHEKIRWKSDQPLTEGQVRSKRDEFWDTAPAFDGRKEIWDALKAAAFAVENIDYDHAQAIIDGANITLPNGTLTECYDELGTRYQLPVYCLSMPLNVVIQTNDSTTEYGVIGEEKGDEIELKVRLSTSLKDSTLIVNSNDTVAQAKRKLDIDEQLKGQRQRWYYSGKMLGDKMAVQDCNIVNGWIIQCIITENEIISTGT